MDATGDICRIIINNHFTIPLSNDSDLISSLVKKECFAFTDAPTMQPSIWDHEMNDHRELHYPFGLVNEPRKTNI